MRVGAIERGGGGCDQGLGGGVGGGGLCAAAGEARDGSGDAACDGGGCSAAGRANENGDHLGGLGAAKTGDTIIPAMRAEKSGASTLADVVEIGGVVCVIRGARRA